MSKLATLAEKRAEIQVDIEAMAATIEKFSRKFSRNEEARFEGLIADARAIDIEIKHQEAAQASADSAAAVRARFVPDSGNTQTQPEGGTMSSITVRESSIYSPSAGHSYFRDVVDSRQYGNTEAAERLRRNATEMRQANTTDGSGGDFAIPAYLVDDFVRLSRPGRVLSDIVRKELLPAGRDSVVLPAITTGTTVAPQATQGASISQTDIATASIVSPVVTIAGAQTVSQQLLDMSPLAMDRVILEDLAADYAKQIEAQVISGAGTSGTLTGVLTLTTANAVTYTATTPTVAGIYAKVGEAIAEIHENTYNAPTAIVMTPRRWQWFASAQDSSGRPLVVPTGAGDNNAYNALATSQGVTAGGPSGFLLGLPVYVSAMVPKTLGTGTNEDRIIVLRASDVELWEATPRLEVFPQTYGQYLNVLVRFHNYAALAVRRPKAIAVIGGTGLVNPSIL